LKVAGLSILDAEAMSVDALRLLLEATDFELSLRHLGFAEG
jgi:hypothetical protein